MLVHGLVIYFEGFPGLAEALADLAVHETQDSRSNSATTADPLGNPPRPATTECRKVSNSTLISLVGIVADLISLGLRV